MVKKKKTPLEQFQGYLYGLLCANEKKISTIAFVLLTTFGSALYLTFNDKPVPTWMQTTIQWCIIGLSGINALGYMGGYGMGMDMMSTPTTTTG
jgi:hypothetical protein